MTLATSQQEFSDADFRVVDNADQSKKLAFEVSGVTTATTRTLTVPNASGTIMLTTSLGVVPVGAVVDYGGTTEPTGWLFCYGQAISRTTYSLLFTAIGTVGGVGDGSTTFNVPDLRGRVVAGQDDMGGTSANRLTGASGGVDGDVLGGSGGAETHTLTTAQLASHAHAGPGNIRRFNNTGPSAWIVDGTANQATETWNTASAGGDTAHNNVQPTFILNKIIYAGV